MFQADCDLEDISNFHHISTLLDFRLAALAILISRVELVGHLVWMMPQNWFIMAPISASIVTGCSRLLHFSIPVARQHQINKINNKLHLHFAHSDPTGPNWSQHSVQQLQLGQVLKKVQERFEVGTRGD